MYRCGLSGKPLYANEKVCVFWLQLQQSTNTQTISYDRIYSFLGLPSWGIYDGEGGLIEEQYNPWLKTYSKFVNVNPNTFKNLALHQRYRDTETEFLDLSNTLQASFVKQESLAVQRAGCGDAKFVYTLLGFYFDYASRRWVHPELPHLTIIDERVYFQGRKRRAAPKDPEEQIFYLSGLYKNFWEKEITSIRKMKGHLISVKGKIEYTKQRLSYLSDKYSEEELNQFPVTFLLEGWEDLPKGILELGRETLTYIFSHSNTSDLIRPYEVYKHSLMENEKLLIPSQLKRKN